MSSDTDFLTLFSYFVIDIKENLAPRWKSAEAFIDGHRLKIKIIEKKLFFPKVLIVCFHSAPFAIDGEGNTKNLTSNKEPFVRRWTWEEYEEKHEHNELLKRHAKGYMKAEDIIENYKAKSWEYEFYTQTRHR